MMIKKRDLILTLPAWEILNGQKQKKLRRNPVIKGRPPVKLLKRKKNGRRDKKKKKKSMSKKLSYE